MDDNSLPPSPAHRPAKSADLALAALVGREFVEALDAGLRRARATDRRRARPVLPSPSPSPAVSEAAAPHRRPDPVPGAEPAPRADPAVVLLRRHAPAILRRFETALPVVGIPGGVPRRVSRLSLTVWARGVLRTAMSLDERVAGRTPPPAADQQVIAAALLLECAATTLPAGHPACTEAIGALARTIRILRTDPATAPATARSAPAPVSARRS
ncbi:hypothetical protein [Streptomyces sp. NBC_00872]|uniref:hypothetical protein n=1 Tax=Streptomyces sp. NBC_00872 TaxID=2903686 RepID=UPI0038630B64|nr:hypothetical protein OG214_33840 [Streptomyces sp. NBC_00872]